MRDELTDGATWRFRLLGRFEAFYRDLPVESSYWRRRKNVSLLKLFLTEPGRVFTQDELIDALFGDLDPHKAIPNLQARISELRRILEPELKRRQNSGFIETVNGTNYRLIPNASIDVDIHEASELFSQAKKYVDQRAWEDAVACYEAGCSASSPELLPEDRYEEWAFAACQRWRESYLEALSAFAYCCARLGRYKRAIDIINDVIAQEPYRERAYRDLMLYAHLLGERQVVQMTYQRCAQLLRNELGVLPSNETRLLHERIQQGDALSLDSLELGLDLKSIAVLPLVNLSGDSEHEYFSDGLTEDIIHRLSRIENLRVIARTSIMGYKNSELSINEIGHELKVSTVLEGSVRWSQDDKIRIGVQLIRTDTESHLWSEVYDREFTDIFEIQSDVAQRIAAALQIQIAEPTGTSGDAPTGDLRAYHSYLKGRHFLNRRTEEDFRKGIRHFIEALEKDPTYAQALAGLADAHGLMAWFSYGPMNVHFPKSHEYAERALGLDANQSEAYTALGYFQLNYEWDWAGSERSFLNAIELNPNHVPAHHWYAELLAVQGRTSEAVEQLRIAVEIDPLSPLIHAVLGWMNYFDRSYAEAEQNCLDAIELDPHFNTAHWILGQVYLQQARYREAIKAFVLTRELSSDHPSLMGLTALAHGRLGEMEQAQSLKSEIEQMLIGGEPNAIAMALVHIGLEQFEEAVAWLKRAYESRAWYVPFIGIEPQYAVLHGSPAFQEILKKLNLDP